MQKIKIRIKDQDLLNSFKNYITAYLLYFFFDFKEIRR